MTNLSKLMLYIRSLQLYKLFIELICGQAYDYRATHVPAYTLDLFLVISKHISKVTFQGNV